MQVMVMVMMAMVNNYYYLPTMMVFVNASGLFSIVRKSNYAAEQGKPFGFRIIMCVPYLRWALSLPFPLIA
jgi:hypothetical protein